MKKPKSDLLQGTLRSADPENLGAGIDARLGNFAAHPTDFRERPASQSRVALIPPFIVSKSKAGSPPLGKRPKTIVRRNTMP